MLNTFYFQGNHHFVEPWLGDEHPWKYAHENITQVKVQCVTREENRYHCDSNPCNKNGKCFGVINDFYCL